MSYSQSIDDRVEAVQRQAVLHLGKGLILTLLGYLSIYLYIVLKNQLHFLVPPIVVSIIVVVLILADYSRFRFHVQIEMKNTPDEDSHDYPKEVDDHEDAEEFKPVYASDEEQEEQPVATQENVQEESQTEQPVATEENAQEESQTEQPQEQPTETPVTGKTIQVVDGSGNILTVTLEGNTTEEEFCAASSMKLYVPPVAPASE